MTDCDCPSKYKTEDGLKVYKTSDLEEEFKKQINDRAKQIDPDQEQDWFSMTLGWALAKGLSPKNAHAFAIHIRYHTELG